MKRQQVISYVVDCSGIFTTRIPQEWGGVLVIFSVSCVPMTQLALGTNLVTNPQFAVLL